MKRILLLMMAVFALATTMFAQQSEEDEPLPPPRKSSGPKFGGAAGFTQNILFLDMSPINQILVANNCAPFSGNGLFMLGGQGYGYVMFLPNLRIGGIGGSGTRISTSLIRSTNTMREVELSAGFGGVTLDYVIPVIPRLDITTGVLLGKGGMSFTLRRNDGTARIWGDAWDQFGSNGPVVNYTTKFSGSFFLIQPNVNFEFALLRWLGLRAGVGYMGMIGNTWKVDDTYDMFGVPDNINGRGWMINGGLFLGTFLY